MSALRIGTFLAPRMRPFYEQAAAALDAELVDGERFSDLEDGTLDAAFLCGLPFVELDGPVPLVAPVLGEGPPVYYSDVVSRPGEDLTSLEQFAGRRLALNEPTSHSGWNVVLATLAERGLSADDFTVVRTGSHANSLAAVREGSADVAAIDSHLLTALGGAGELSTIERLGPSPSQPLAVSSSMPEERHDEIRAVLTALPPWGAGFTWARVEDADYDVIRAMRQLAVSSGRSSSS